jgi:hypothetical protein
MILPTAAPTATARAVPRDGMVPERVENVVKSYAEIGRSLRIGVQLPYKKKVRGEAQALAALAGNGMEAVRFETILSDEIVEIYRPEPALKPVELAEAYGAVTGRVQTLTSRSEFRFTLYDRYHDRAVSCYLARDRTELMREMWDRLATVEGWITRDPFSGRPLSVRRITNVTPIAEVGTQAYLDARGLVRSKERSEDVIRRLRDAW